MANILFLFPHPDDETLFAGGAMLRHARNGDKITCILASNGERSGESKNRSPRFFFIVFYLLGHLRFLLFIQKIIIRLLAIFWKSDKELAEMRKNEARKALGLLGAGEIIFWEIEDMKFSQHKEELIRLVEKNIQLSKPEIIYTFHPNGLTGHPDHITLTECLMAVLRQTDSEKIKVFGAGMAKSAVKKHGLPFLGVEDSLIKKEISLNESEVEKKKEALAAYVSQQYLWGLFLEKFPALIGKEYFV